MAHQPHQWHPPPPPQYGGLPFQYQPQLQTPSQQQFPYNPSAPSPSIRQQYAYPPPISQSRFDANGQIPSPNSIPPQYSSAGFNPALFRQFANSSLPPPPPPSFPPLPLPNGTFSQFIPPPQVSNHNFQNQYSPHGQPMAPSLQLQQYRTAGQPNHNMEQNSLPQAEKQQEMNIGDRELGDSRTNVATMSAEDLGQNNNNNPTDILQRQIVDAAAPSSSDRTDSVSSYNPPSATPPESGETAAESSNRVQTGAIKVGEASKYQGRGAFEMRELAKGALLSLAPHNIKFSDLLAEGIDAQLLSQLFEEVGLRTTPSAMSSTPAATKTLTADSSAVQSTPGRPFPSTNLASKAQPNVDVNEPAAGVALSPSATSTVVRQQVAAPATTALAATKASDSQPSASPTMERKDVIAAMLAAKMGKPIIRKESPGAGLPGLPAKVASAPLTVPPSRSAPLPRTTPLDPTDGFPRIPTDEPTAKSTPKTRGKAQTELVRQKMEQLKRETAAKAKLQEASQLSSSPSASRSASVLAKGLSTYPQAGLPIKPVSREVLMDKMQNSSVTGTAPALNATFASSIPGLFMMDADPDPEIIPSPRQGSSTIPPAVLDNIAVSESTPPSEASRGTQSQQLTAIDVDVLIGENSGYRVSSKRPPAVDAFDEQDLPPAKQQDSRPTSSRGLDSSLNDGQSDNISEGEIMEIDDESPISPLPKTSGSRSYPISSGAIVAWPSIDTSASPNMPRQGIASSVRPMDTGRQPDVNGRPIATPSKHNLELEAVKKKLAEAEERRKAKQSASQLQSPASSPVNRPSVPKSSSPLALSATNAMPVTVARQQYSQQPNPADQTKSQPSSNGIESKSPATSVPVDSVQRAKELREKLLRQRMLKQGLPELDKEVQKTQSRQAQAQARLAQLRREAEKREAEAREARKREQEIMEEVKRLEQQLEMGMNGQQQFSREMESLDQEISPDVATNTEQASKSLPSSIAVVPSEEIPGNTGDDTPQSVNNINEEPTEEDEAPESGDSFSNSEDEPSRQDYNNRLVRPSAEAALPTAEEEAAFLRPAMVDESVSDEEGFVSPEDSDHRQEANMSPRDNSQYDYDDSAMEVDSDSDGSASMSDSGSEDYQPAEPIISTEKLEDVDDEDEEYDPMDAPISGGQFLAADEDQEDYEPSEVVEQLELQTPLPFTIQTGSPVSNGSASKNESEHGDDREHGLELTEANTLTTPQELLPSIPNAASTDNNPRASKPSTSHFTPYHSPLSNFKSYRFNPQFTDRVPDGYRSLTYSNAIDPTKPLCPTEAEGGVCTDVDCEEQHFGQMSLADEKILVQMSSASDIPDKAQRESFVAGLKLVISDLRTKHISDFDQVASELAAYRRRFRQEQDPSLAFTSDEL